MNWWAAARRLGRVENTDIAQYSHPSVTFGDSSPTGEPLERKLQFIYNEMKTDFYCKFCKIGYDIGVKLLVIPEDNYE